MRRVRAEALLLAALLLAAALLAACGGADATTAAATEDEPLLVAAASDLLPAAPALGASFEQATGTPVRFAFGSSGRLAQQVLAGAPYEVFASADTALVDRVVAAGRGAATSRGTYAVGGLAIWATEGTWGGWRDLAELAADPAVRVLAIAHHDHAPYGRAAREALAAAGALEALGPRLVLGESASDAQRLAASGNADAALLPRSLAIAADARGEGRWNPVDAGLHAPLRQDAVVTTEDPARARLAAAFVAHLRGEQGRAVLERFGFAPPDDLDGEAGAP